MKKPITLLDCTLRDGSYVINYQFTAEDTYIVSRALSQAGIPYIEVGHGVGLDAQYKGSGEAAESDIRYIEAAKAGVVGDSKVGVFFIPGIGELDSIRKAADAGLDFIRIGTDVHESKIGKKSISLAKSLGLEVSSNLMKSYSISPSKFIDSCKIVEGFGADVISLIDSAGGMTPTEVRAYISAMKSEISTLIGFHGHNNLELAVANCLVAIEEGADIIDGSLMGMGRSAGNASTNILASLLSREGVDLGCLDWQMLMRISEELIVPLIPQNTGMESEKLASGLSYFHSSYTKLINRMSEQYDVLPYETILNLTEESRLEVTPKMAEVAAAKASKFSVKNSWNIKKVDSMQIKPWKSAHPTTVTELLHVMEELSSKTGYLPVLTVSRSRNSSLKSLRIPPVYVGHGYCVGHIETSVEAEADLLENLDGLVSRMMIDRLIDVPARLFVGITVASYDDDVLVNQTLCDFIRLNPNLKSFYLPQMDNKLGASSVENLKLYSRFSEKEVDVGIATNAQKKFKACDVDRIKEGGILLLAQSEAADRDAVDKARSKKLSVHRLDLSEALLGEVVRTFGMIDRLKQHAGSLDTEHTQIVAGGVVGKLGSIVVNSLKKPTRIHGVADGYGGLTDFGNLNAAQQESILKWMSGQINY